MKGAGKLLSVVLAVVLVSCTGVREQTESCVYSGFYCGGYGASLVNPDLMFDGNDSTYAELEFYSSDTPKIYDIYIKSKTMISRMNLVSSGKFGSANSYVFAQALNRGTSANGYKDETVTQIFMVNDIDFQDGKDFSVGCTSDIVKIHFFVNESHCKKFRINEIRLYDNFGNLFEIGNELKD